MEYFLPPLDAVPSRSGGGMWDIRHIRTSSQYIGDGGHVWCVAGTNHDNINNNLRFILPFSTLPYSTQPYPIL